MVFLRIVGWVEDLHVGDIVGCNEISKVSYISCRDDGESN